MSLISRIIHVIAAPLLAAALFSACGSGSNGMGSTEAGNPTEPILGSDFPSASDTNPSTYSVVWEMKDTVCAKLTDECFPDLVAAAICEPAFLGSTSIGTTLGLGQKYANLSVSQIIDLERAKTLVSDNLAGHHCTNEIAAMACDDPRLTAAFDPMRPDDFSRIAEMIPTTPESCGNIFSK